MAQTTQTIPTSLFSLKYLLRFRQNHAFVEVEPDYIEYLSVSNLVVIKRQLNLNDLCYNSFVENIWIRPLYGKCESIQDVGHEYIKN
jgi:hypothetical protein